MFAKGFEFGADCEVSVGLGDDTIEHCEIVATEPEYRAFPVGAGVVLVGGAGDCESAGLGLIAFAVGVVDQPHASPISEVDDRVHIPVIVSRGTGREFAFTETVPDPAAVEEQELLIGAEAFAKDDLIEPLVACTHGSGGDKRLGRHVATEGLLIDRKTGDSGPRFGGSNR